MPGFFLTSSSSALCNSVRAGVPVTFAVTFAVTSDASAAVTGCRMQVTVVSSALKMIGGLLKQNPLKPS